jgi:hypothetical protein
MNGEEEKILNEVEKIRAKNNKNWMNILRLAFKSSPKKAKEIFSNISKCDKEINKLTERLSK